MATKNNYEGMDWDDTNLTELFARSLLRRTKNTTESLQIFDAVVQIKNWKPPQPEMKSEALPTSASCSVSSRN